MFNYFGMIEDNYCRYIGFNKPLVVRFDGVNITKNLNINMLDVNPGGFAYALINTARIMSEKYRCFAIAESDEISLVFAEPSMLKRKFSSNKVQKISSIFSQEIFEVFNTIYNGDTVYFDAKTFNIPFDKIESYIKYRQLSAKCVCNTYLAKRYLAPKYYRRRTLTDIIKNLDEHCEKTHHYEYIMQGILYLNGKYITRESYFSNEYLTIID